MCVVLLATSLPIALAANGAYNPAPYFTQEAQEKGAAAWLDEGGNLQIRFPAAVGRPTHAVWSKNPNETVDVKAIDYYIVEVSDLGGKLEKHNTQPPVLLSKKVWASDIMALAEGDTLYAVFTADEIGDLLNVEDNRYNVAITAVDEAGWFSLTLHALIFDVPEFYFDMDKFEVLSEDPYAMREMMRFEAAGDYTGYQQTGNTVDTLERAAQTGDEDPETGIDTYGYRIRITGRRLTHPKADRHGTSRVRPRFGIGWIFPKWNCRGFLSVCVRIRKRLITTCGIRAQAPPRITAQSFILHSARITTRMQRAKNPMYLCRMQTATGKKL